MPPKIWTADDYRREWFNQKERAEKAEEALRWREWPEEPETEGTYIIKVAEFKHPTACYYDGEQFMVSFAVTHWLPIPPMKEE